MTTIKTSLICNKFAGIRRIDARFTADVISCSDCQNVELFNTGVGSGVGVRTAKGNIQVSDYIVNDNLTVYTLSEGAMTQVATDGEVEDYELSFTLSSETVDELERDREKDKIVSSNIYYAFSKTEEGVTTTYYIKKPDEIVKGIFQSSQNSTDYCLIYTENATIGKLYNYSNGVFTQLLSNLTKTGKACGKDFTQGYNDLFMFSNGAQVVKVDMDASPQATILSLTGTESETVTGLGLKVFNSRLWIFKNNRLWYSYKGDCTDFSTVDPAHTTSAGYIEFSKNITAIYEYLGSLAVFHKDSSTLVNVDSEDNFSVLDDSPGGCASYNSLVFHGTDLYFYDDTKKGVFSFQQVVNGDKTLGQNIALDIQEELLEIKAADIDEIQALSVVLSDRNEVWFKLPVDESTGTTTIMIFDLIHGEWIKRVEQPIYSLGIINNQVYSGGEKIYEEYNSYTWDKEFISAYYYATPMNMGSDNTLKMLYFPPRLTIDTTKSNEFYVRYIKNYDFFKRQKIKHIIAKTVKNILYWDKGYYDSGYYYPPKDCTSIIKLPTNTFKTLEMRLYTNDFNQGFCIRSMEFSKIKVKTA